MADITKAIEAISETVGKAIARVESEIRGQVQAVKDAGEAYRASLQAGIDGLASRVEGMDAAIAGHIGAGFDMAKAYADARSVALEEKLAAIPAGPQGERGEKGDSGAAATVDPLMVTLAVQAAIPPVDEIAKSVVAVVETWKPELKGDQGPAGESVIGPKGESGRDGTQLVFGDGPPLMEGAKGDVYIDVKSGDVYSFA